MNKSKKLDFDQHFNTSVQAGEKLRRFAPAECLLRKSLLIPRSLARFSVSASLARRALSFSFLAEKLLALFPQLYSYLDPRGRVAPSRGGRPAGAPLSLAALPPLRRHRGRRGRRRGPPPRPRRPAAPVRQRRRPRGRGPRGQGERRGGRMERG